MKKLLVFLRKPFTLTIVGAMLAVTLIAAVPASIVYAETVDDPGVVPVHKQGDFSAARFFGGIISRTFFYQKNMAKFLSRQVEQADEVAANAQLRITELEDEGKDVAALKTALDIYYDKVADAKQAMDAADSSINPHKGFDEDGRVTDLELARDTIKELEEDISTARNAIIEAIRAIVDGMQTFRESNPSVGN